MEMIIVTGLSGAGKTQAVHCLEDLGYYCVDNIPPMLIMDFMNLVGTARPGLSKVGFVVDIRGGEFLDSLRECLEELKKAEVDVKIMFLEASDQTLVRRYKESRRSHPLAPDGNIREGIRLEREKLSFARASADYVIDTSSLKTAQLYRHVTKLLQPGTEEERFIVTIESFGYKFGMPLEADWVLDARFLQNPFYVPSLKHLTGRNQKVRDYVMRSGECGRFAGRVAGQIIELMPSYVREGKYHLHVAIGCTGGRHRSVVTAEELAARLRETGIQVNLMHRELDHQVK